MTTKTQQQRIAAARKALDAYGHACANSNQSTEETVIDLLTDLRHYLDQEQIDVRRTLRLADLHYEAERDETYNGWSNYETWAAHLWLTNEQGSYAYWRSEAGRQLREADDAEQVAKGIWTVQQAARFRLAEQLKEEHLENAPEQDPSVYSDLLTAALDEVDWSEVAAALLEECEESA